MAAASWQPPHGCIAAAHTAHAQGAACTWSARQACEVGAVQGCGARRARSNRSRFSHRSPAARAGNRSPSSAAPPARRSKHVDVLCCCRGASARMSLSAQPAEAAERACPTALDAAGRAAVLRRLGRRPTASKTNLLEVLDERNGAIAGTEPSNRAPWPPRPCTPTPPGARCSDHPQGRDARHRCGGERRRLRAGRGLSPPALAARRRACAHGQRGAAAWRAGRARAAQRRRTPCQRRHVARAIGMRAGAAGGAAADPRGAARERGDARRIVPIRSPGARARDLGRARSACHGRLDRSQSCTIDVLYQYAVIRTRVATKRVFAEHYKWNFAMVRDFKSKT